MGAQYITRTGNHTTAVGTLATLGSLAGSTVNDQTVPQGVNAIVALIVSITNEIVSTADAGASCFVRLVGNGIVDGGQMDISVGSIKNGTTSTSHTVNPPVYIPTNISVKPGNTVQVQFEQDGVDVGTPRATVTCVYQ